MFGRPDDSTKKIIKAYIESIDKAIDLLNKNFLSKFDFEPLKSEFESVVAELKKSKTLLSRAADPETFDNAVPLINKIQSHPQQFNPEKVFHDKIFSVTDKFNHQVKPVSDKIEEINQLQQKLETLKNQTQDNNLKTNLDNQFHQLEKQKDSLNRALNPGFSDKLFRKSELEEIRKNPDKISLQQFRDTVKNIEAQINQKPAVQQSGRASGRTNRTDTVKALIKLHESQVNQLENQCKQSNYKDDKLLQHLNDNRSKIVNTIMKFDIQGDDLKKLESFQTRLNKLHHDNLFKTTTSPQQEDQQIATRRLGKH